jgi:glycosyltransferase A (GT-A) superfamily protein (DUF2064 family)
MEAKSCNLEKPFDAKGLAICILAKGPVIGNVKTRLSETVGGELAVKMYEKLLLNTVLQANQCEISDSEIMVVSSDIANEACLRSFLGDSVKIVMYDDDTKRLTPLIRKIFYELLVHENYQKVLIMCSDSPFITPDLIRQADVALSKDVGLLFMSPASDGCYSAIGLNVFAELFPQKPVSSPEVFDNTLRLAVSQGLRICLSGIIDDLDNIADARRILPLLNKANDPSGLVKNQIAEMLSTRC